MKKIAQSDFYPQLNMNAAYSINNSTSEAGILFSNRSLGPSFTLNLRWNVFGSMNRIRNLRQAEMEVNSAQLFQEQIRFVKNTELKKYYETYARVSQIAELDQQNLDKIQEQITIAEQAFENGKINALELREIQFSVLEIQLNQIESMVQLEMSKANIASLSGQFQKMLAP